MGTTRPVRVNYPRGRMVDSYSLIDRGLNPLTSFSLQDNVIRKGIGDILFLCSRGAGAEAEIFFAPEYPNQMFGAMENAMTYYVLRFDRFCEDPVFEVAPWDADLRMIPWDEGIKFLSGVSRNQLSVTQQRLADEIMRIDRASKEAGPIDPSQGRTRVGKPWGARFSVKPIVLGYG
jgi:hypothetical protein